MAETLQDPTPNAVDFAFSELHERYESLRELGRGGQGRTLLARERETGRQVAVKEISLTHVQDWKAVELFGREIEAMGRLDHPGIPALIEAPAVNEDRRRLYLVREFVEGDSLAERLEAGAHFDEAWARGFMREMLGLDVLEVRQVGDELLGELHEGPPVRRLRSETSRSGGRCSTLEVRDRAI